MYRFLLFFPLFIFSLPHAKADEWNPNISLGVAFSGPTLGFSISTRIDEGIDGRIIFGDNKMFQGQLLFYRDPLRAHHVLLGAGKFGERLFVRGAFAKNWQRGPWELTGELGLNLPLNKTTEEVELYSLVFESTPLLVFVGMGLQYGF